MAARFISRLLQGRRAGRRVGQRTRRRECRRRPRGRWRARRRRTGGVGIDVVAVLVVSMAEHHVTIEFNSVLVDERHVMDEPVERLGLADRREQRRHGVVGLVGLADVLGLLDRTASPSAAYSFSSSRGSTSRCSASAIARRARSTFTAASAWGRIDSMNSSGCWPIICSHWSTSMPAAWSWRTVACTCWLTSLSTIGFGGSIVDEFSELLVEERMICWRTAPTLRSAISTRSASRSTPRPCRARRGSPTPSRRSVPGSTRLCTAEIVTSKSAASSVSFGAGGEGDHVACARADQSGRRSPR